MSGWALNIPGDTMRILLVIIFMLLLFGRVEAMAADNVKMPDRTQIITPVWSQLVVFWLAKGFKPAADNTNGPSFRMEFVPERENVNAWSQMITLTGAKGSAGNPSLTPQTWVAGIGSGFKRTCPDTFSAAGLGAIKVDGFDAFAAWFSCGTVPGQPHGEMALIVGIKGTADYYTIQWAERSAPSAKPVAFDQAKWVDRFKKLTPIKLCPIVPGEAPPYVSCLNRKQPSG